VGLAVLGRFYLGRNWGLPASRKENPELVTDGPYSYVRHPIYGGILLAMLGTAIGAGAFWVVPLVLAANTDVSSVRIVSKIPKLSANFGRLATANCRESASAGAIVSGWLTPSRISAS
jgi:protein-S-isoprenylcysteine O-methyltransferase Ste14